jgi:protocatechuate 3,4-dioxygenase beta subunit
MSTTPDLYDLGLNADLSMLARSPVSRRRLLRLGAASIGVVLTACSRVGPGGLPGNAGVATRASADGACVEVPAETGGPFPADGANASRQTLNILTQSGVVRQNITASLGTKHVAPGVPTTVVLTLININANCAPLANHALYIWHCTRDGLYSMYSSGITDEDFLRGVQATDSAGNASFQTIFPGCYDGRWPHIHFEVFPSLEEATGPDALLHTSQLAIPKDACDAVYASAEGYAASAANLARLSLETDIVFSDTGGKSQLAAVSGDATAGYTLTLTVGVAA